MTPCWVASERELRARSRLLYQKAGMMGTLPEMWSQVTAPVTVAPTRAPWGGDQLMSGESMSDRGLQTVIPTKRSSSSLASSHRSVKVSFSKSSALSRDRMGWIMDGQGAKMVVTIAVSCWGMHESRKDHIFDSIVRVLDAFSV